jgi:indolepyruvate decarboxylase
LNGIAGAYAEHLPLFHLVGTPNMGAQSRRAVMHHTLGNGDYNLFQRMTEPVVCAQAVMHPQNVAQETERLIAEALYHRRPVYMAFPGDHANEPVVSTAQAVPPPGSDPAFLGAAVDAIVAALEKARSACFLPGILLSRTQLQSAMQAVIEASGLPFATMFMGKSVLDEQHPSYIGMYDGALMNEGVRDFVESCDLVIEVGTIHSDFNTGAFTAKLDPAKLVNITHHRTSIGGKIFPSVEIGDMLAALAKRLPRHHAWSRPQIDSIGELAGSGADPITAAALYPRWANFLKPNDILVAETGSASMGLGFAQMPAGASFHNQTLWGSIGWATAAAFGAAVAAPQRRVVLVTGEGSHQLTAQEVGQFGRMGLQPVIFILNNSGYLIERLLSKYPASAYNDVAPWRYTELPHALGCDGWFTARAATCGELDQALETAATRGGAAYIEVVTGAYEASPLALKLHDSMQNLYKS